MTDKTTHADAPNSRQHQLNVVFVVAWVICSLFYFGQYVLRSAPSIMLPEISAGLSIDNIRLNDIIGVYFYAYAVFALISGILLDRIGPRFTAPGGILLVAVGCVLFGSGSVFGAGIGRFLQGAGSGVAFTSAVFLATRGFPKQWLATAVGVTQCFGMLGGFMGQAVVSPIIKHQIVTWQTFWMLSAAALILMCMASLAVTPRTREGKVNWSGMSRPYAQVLKNPQSYLCSVVAALMFLPTNIADFTWGTPFLVDALGVEPAQAASRLAMVPLGWVIGCPLLGYLSDYLGRRKIVVQGSLLVMLVVGVLIVYLPHSVPPYFMGLLFGIASGAAMVPYTIIKEVNDDEVKGTATGVINFIVFVTSAIMGNVFGALIRSLSAAEGMTLHVFQSADWIFAGGLVLALVLTFFIRETGSKTRPDVLLVQDK